LRIIIRRSQIIIAGISVIAVSGILTFTVFSSFSASSSGHDVPDQADLKETPTIVSPDTQPTNTCTPEGFAYIIQPGDTMDKIFILSDSSIPDILELNPQLDPNKIYAHQTIILPKELQLNTTAPNPA